ncbi:hypothetical protein PR048_025103 [Dryococelus australis]|uniref:Uncharacterized protein n=1 Tax=Dryococelus australis TaxID=614101 RepID=A0ABQ9GQG5_9NEOP|nr:hypothetical protein PR048_025103 [Dryococelus australis]
MVSYYMRWPIPYTFLLVIGKGKCVRSEEGRGAEMGEVERWCKGVRAERREGGDGGGGGYCGEWKGGEEGLGVGGALQNCGAGGSGFDPRLAICRHRQKGFLMSLKKHFRNNVVIVEILLLQVALHVDMNVVIVCSVQHTNRSTVISAMLCLLLVISYIDIRRRVKVLLVDHREVKANIVPRHLRLGLTPDKMKIVNVNLPSLYKTYTCDNCNAWEVKMRKHSPHSFNGESREDRQSQGTPVLLKRHSLESGASVRREGWEDPSQQGREQETKTHAAPANTSTHAPQQRYHASRALHIRRSVANYLVIRGRGPCSARGEHAKTTFCTGMREQRSANERCLATHQFQSKTDKIIFCGTTLCDPDGIVMGVMESIPTTPTAAPEPRHYSVLQAVHSNCKSVATFISVCYAGDARKFKLLLQDAKWISYEASHEKAHTKKSGKSREKRESQHTSFKVKYCFVSTSCERRSLSRCSVRVYERCTGPVDFPLDITSKINNFNERHPRGFVAIPLSTIPRVEQWISARLTSPLPAIQFVPKMFYRVEVGALGGLVQSANIIVGSTSPDTLPDLARAAQVEWDLLPEEHINTSIASMPRRVKPPSHCQMFPPNCFQQRIKLPRRNALNRVVLPDTGGNCTIVRLWRVTALPGALSSFLTFKAPCNLDFRPEIKYQPQVVEDVFTASGEVDDVGRGSCARSLNAVLKTLASVSSVARLPMRAEYFCNSLYTAGSLVVTIS